MHGAKVWTMHRHSGGRFRPVSCMLANCLCDFTFGKRRSATKEERRAAAGAWSFAAAESTRCMWFPVSHVIPGPLLPGTSLSRLETGPRTCVETAREQPPTAPTKSETHPLQSILIQYILLQYLLIQRYGCFAAGKYCPLWSISDLIHRTDDNGARERLRWKDHARRGWISCHPARQAASALESRTTSTGCRRCRRADAEAREEQARTPYSAFKKCRPPSKSCESEKNPAWF